MILKKDIHSINTNSLKDLRCEDDFYDVTLVGDDNHQVSAHKVILATCSQYFKKVLKQNKHSSPLLCLLGLNHCDLKHILDYIYYGEVQLQQEELNRFLYVAKILELDGADQTETSNLNEESSRKEEFCLILREDECKAYEYFACFDQRIVEDDNNILDEDDCSNEILAIYRNGTETIRRALSSLNNSHIWDYSGNCHTRLYQNTSFPIGHSVGGDMNSFSVAVYCKDITYCQGQLQTSNQNTGNVGLIDLTFRQNKCIHAADLTDFPDPVSDTDLSVEHGGKFSCVDACRNATGEYVLAVVDETNCYCTTYGDAFPNVMEDRFNDCHPCPDNDNFTCGKQNLYSVYHTKDDFGVNAGYKYFQCVNAKLYNDPKELLDPNLIQVNSVETATECLTNCKAGGFGIVFLNRIMETGLLECTCIKEHFYSFAMQDLSSNCLISIKDSSFWWCPDLDGPCMDEEGKSSVVYCSDYSYCNENHVASTAQDFICSKDVKKPDPFMSPDLNCSDTFYKCERNIGERLTWIKHSCPEGEVFSTDVNINKCTVECNPNLDGPPIIEGECNEYDHTGTLWKANLTTTAEKDCKEWNENYSGTQKWICSEGPKFEGNDPDTSDCEEDWIHDIGNQVTFDN